MKIETKVAWPKDHDWNTVLLKQLRDGADVSHREMLAAVDDRDNQIVFDPTSAHPLVKQNFVIFQYAVFLQRPDGKVAIFERAVREQGQDRITSGRSMLISQSTPGSPGQAVPRLIHYQLLVGKRAKIKSLSPCGLVWNALPPKKGHPQPVYVFAVYQHLMPDNIPLHGRFKDTPDSFVEWVAISDLPRHMSNSGYIDQLFAEQLAAGRFAAIDEGNDGVIFSPKSKLISDAQPPDRFDVIDYTHGHNVFISHASEDSFSAFAMYRFLIDESSRTILATLDLTDVRDGEHLSKLERLIGDCDGVVLVITPSLLEKSERLRASSEKDWVQWEIETAIKAGKPIIGFKLGTVGRPHYLPQDLVVNNKAAYGDWLAEIRTLVERVKTKFGV